MPGNPHRYRIFDIPSPAGFDAVAAQRIWHQFGKGAPHRLPSLSFLVSNMTDARRVRVAASNGFIRSQGRQRISMARHEAIKSVSLQMPRNQSIAMIGPSGCGKSTFLRSINRLNDLIPGCRVAGELLIGGNNVYADGVDLVSLRRRVGLVFQKPNPFPKSIYDNVAFGPRLQGFKGRAACWMKLSKIHCEKPPCGKK